MFVPKLLGGIKPEWLVNLISVMFVTSETMVVRSGFDLILFSL
jgi:hypothetical protein